VFPAGYGLSGPVVWAHTDGGKLKNNILKWFQMLTDLVPRENLEAWLKYLRRSLPAVPFKASTQLQGRHLGRRKMKKAAAEKKVINEISVENKELQGSKCFGAELVMSLLANYCRNRGIKTSISVGIVGKWN
jgi:nuclear GTP-binding protein